MSAKDTSDQIERGSAANTFEVGDQEDIFMAELQTAIDQGEDEDKIMMSGDDTTKLSRKTGRPLPQQPTPSHQPSDPFALPDRQHSASTTKRSKSSRAVQVDSDSEEVEQNLPNTSTSSHKRLSSSSSALARPSRGSGRMPPSDVFRSGTVIDSYGRRIKGGECMFGSSILIDDDDEDLPPSAFAPRRQANPPSTPYTPDRKQFGAPQNLTPSATHSTYDVPAPASHYILTFIGDMGAHEKYHVGEAMQERGGEGGSKKRGYPDGLTAELVREAAGDGGGRRKRAGKEKAEEIEEPEMELLDKGRKVKEKVVPKDWKPSNR